MTSLRPRYGRYLLWWCAVWFPVTLLTQMPECYERSPSLAQWRHTSIPSETVGFAFSRLLMEVPFALLWGSLSWLLLWGALVIENRLDRRSVQYREKPVAATIVRAIVLVAALEAVILGVPLARMNTECANFSLATDDEPAVTITDRSVGIESGGVLLVFPLASLAAGCAVARYHRR